MFFCLSSKSILHLKDKINLSNRLWPNLKAIFAANDGMALGAVEAAYAAGKGGDIIIVGVPHSNYRGLQVPKNVKTVDLWGIL